MFIAGPHWPTWKVKLPLVVWVSTESTRQFTRYVPVPPGRNETEISLPLTRGLPASRRCPAGPVTVTLLNAGSSFWVNQSVTSCGGLASLLPTRGSAWSRKACACAAPVASTSESAVTPIRDEHRMVLPRKRAGGLDGTAEDRLADAVRVDVVKIKVQLRNDADICSALPVDRYQRLNAELKLVADPKNTGADGAGRHPARGQRIRHRRLQVGLDQRDQVINELRQTQIDHGRLQIRHAVLNGPAPVQDARVKFGIGRQLARIWIDAEGRGGVSARDRVAKLAGDGDRAEPG